MHSLTVENYVKEIYKLCVPEQHDRATTGRLAAAMNVSPGTVTSMLKSLSESGLVTYTPYEGVRLTAAGNDLALRVLRRHRLIEAFLTHVLDLDWDEVHEDAERMEHVVSDALIERISEYLENPIFDPHGDPIPTRDGIIMDRNTQPLVDCPPGCRFTLAQVTDQSSEFLRYLRQSGLALGQEGKVVANQPEAATLTVELSGQGATLDRAVAGKILVTTGDSASDAVGIDNSEA